MQPVNAILPAFEGINSELAKVPPSVSAVLEIDLAAVQQNFRFLQQQLSTARCGAVVKANAYGLGSKFIAPALAAVDCKDFFVATIDEALQLSSCLPVPSQAAIYVLNGLPSGTEQIFSHHNFMPVLNDLEQIAAWQNHAKIVGHRLPTAINFDTGLCRLGLMPSETERLIHQPERLEGLTTLFYMSHLACSDQPGHPQNESQLQTFQMILQHLPSAPASFANSNGIFLGQQYHFDLVRPGRSLYGLEPRSSNQRVARIFAKILQFRNIPAQQPVGYDATFIAPKPMTIATLGIGYADGLNRALSNKGAVYFAGVQCPILGRVSMDLMVIDVSHVPESLLEPGLWVEVMGDNMRPDDLAQTANTISREILAHLGPRMHRIYKGANEA